MANIANISWVWFKTITVSLTMNLMLLDPKTTASSSIASPGIYLSIFCAHFSELDLGKKNTGQPGIGTVKAKCLL